MVENDPISSNTVNVLHTFQYSIENIAFSSIQTVHVFTIIFFVSALEHPHAVCILP